MELWIAVVRYTIPEPPAGGGAECARAVGWSSRFGAGAREIMETRPKVSVVVAFWGYRLGSVKLVKPKRDDRIVRPSTKALIRKVPISMTALAAAGVDFYA